jgi:beta-glucosidase
MDLVAGKAEPSALLPFQMPRDMETVEAQAEDIARDLIPYTDAAGNTWDFAFGLNCQGVINDERVKKYR